MEFCIRRIGRDLIPVFVKHADRLHTEQGADLCEIFPVRKFRRSCQHICGNLCFVQIAVVILLRHTFAFIFIIFDLPFNLRKMLTVTDRLLGQGKKRLHVESHNQNTYKPYGRHSPNLPSNCKVVINISLQFPAFFLLLLDHDKKGISDNKRDHHKKGEQDDHDCDISG